MSGKILNIIRLYFAGESMNIIAIISQGWTGYTLLHQQCKVKHNYTGLFGHERPKHVLIFLIWLKVTLEHCTNIDH